MTVSGSEKNRFCGKSRLVGAYVQNDDLLPFREYVTTFLL